MSNMKDIYFPQPLGRISLHSSLPSPIWALQDTPRGHLEGTGSSVTYIAPEWDPQSKTSNADIQALVAIDIVSAQGGLHYQAATMITFLQGRPTHKLEIESANGHAHLSFSYQRRDGSWVEVPLEETSWYILAGNGKVDKKTGHYYSSANNPSPNTVILAVHDDKAHWYFDFITIPS